MKPAIPPVRGALHKALSEGCCMWMPVVLPIGKSGLAAHQVDAPKDAPQGAGSGIGKGSAAKEVEVDSLDLFAAYQSYDQRSHKEDDEYEEQDLRNLDGTCGDAGKTE